MVLKIFLLLPYTILTGKDFNNLFREIKCMKYLHSGNIIDEPSGKSSFKKNKDIYIYRDLIIPVF